MMNKYRYSVITVNFDDYEIMREIDNPLDDVEYIYVTNNRNIQSNTWKIIVDESYNVFQNSFDKVVEFRKRVLDYCTTDVCCRIDGSVKIKGDAFDKTVSEFNNGCYDISFIMHPWYNNVSTEYGVWRDIRNMSPYEVDKVLEYFKKNSYDSTINTVYTLAMLIQRNNEVNRCVNEKQYEVLCDIRDFSNVGNFNRCDQAVFTYTLDKYFSNIKVLPLHYSILERPNVSSIFFHNNSVDCLYNKFANFSICYVLFGKNITRMFNGDRWVKVLTNDDIRRDSIKILLKTPEIVHNYSDYVKHNEQSYEDWFKNEDVITIGSSDLHNFQYDDPYNKHHFTTDWYYNNVLPIIVSQLGIKYNEDDFVTVCRGNITCKIPKISSIFDVYCPEFHRNEDSGYVEVFYYIDCIYKETTGTMFMADELHKQDVFFTNNDDFHKIFKYSHLPVKIVNHDRKNQDVLLLIGNSHTIPFIPILTKYFYKVIIIDNRLDEFTYDFMFAYENITHILVLGSYEIDKEKLLSVTKFE